MNLKEDLYHRSGVDTEDASAAPGLVFSIILPVVHGGAHLEDALRSLDDMEFDAARFEVLVAGPNSDYGSRAVMERMDRESSKCFLYIPVGSGRISRLLNAACRSARGDYWVFVDDDCEFPPDGLKILENIIQRENTFGILGGQDRLKGGSAFDGALDIVLNSFLGTGGLRRGRGIRGGKYFPKLWNMVAPREVALSAAGGEGTEGLKVFDESLDVYLDVDLAGRIEASGRRILYTPEFVVWHKRRTNFRSFFRRNAAMAGTSRMLGVHRLAHCVLACAVLGIPALLLLGSLFDPLRWAGYLTAAGYGAGVIGASGWGAARAGEWRAFPWAMLLFVSLHVARAVGYLAGRFLVRISTAC